MACDVAGDLTTAGGVADVYGILQVQVLRQLRQISCVGVHVVALRCLRGATVATSVMGNHAVALAEEEQHLVVPVVPGQRPSVMEDDGLTTAPVLVEQLSAIAKCEIARPLLPTPATLGLTATHLACQDWGCHRKCCSRYAGAHYGAAGGSFSLLAHGENSRLVTAPAANKDRKTRSRKAHRIIAR
ncbi:hypothetical protein FQZ97_802650 [compost metagenome]